MTQHLENEEPEYVIEHFDGDSSSKSEKDFGVQEDKSMKAEDLKLLTKDQDLNVPDDESVASEDSEMEPFEDYKIKIEELLSGLDMVNFNIEPLHHGYSFQNNVYALTSSQDPTEQYVLRVPVLPDFRESDGVCEAVENDACLLDFVHKVLPVPKVKTFGATKDNPLSAPLMIQSKLPGKSLDQIYDDLSQEAKLEIIEQVVELVVKLESIQFDAAGKFVASPPEAATATPHPTIQMFNEGDPDFLDAQTVAKDRQGSDLKAFLLSHMNGWVAKELKDEAEEGEASLSLPLYRKLLSIIDTLSDEGAFAAGPYPIVLHHWDFEPRNIMVENTTGTWRVSGIIDWDDAIAVPRPLARRPLDWIWDLEGEGYTGYLNTDHQPKSLERLTAEETELKAKFDALATEKLVGYPEDAYGHGRWLRRLWTFARSGGNTCWYLELMDLMIKDWEERPKPVVRQPWTIWGLVRWFRELLKPWGSIEKLRDAFWQLVGRSKV